jgi:hypothetical protein
MTQNKSASPSEKKSLKKSLALITRKIDRLAALLPEKRDAAICDIIDLRGPALALLLKRLPDLPVEIQKLVAVRVEDLLFFHPARGKRLLPRLMTALAAVDPACEPHLVAAAGDVIAALPPGKAEVPEAIIEPAARLLEAPIDLLRKGKAVELLSLKNSFRHIPALLRTFHASTAQIDSYANFTFFESTMFALKKLGGEGLLRLLVNPQSIEGMTQFRMKWHQAAREDDREVIQQLSRMGDDFPGMVLKVIDLSENNIPFLASIQEGLKHTDKWIRQMATASMSKVKTKDGLEFLGRMLKDDSQEVRMMAVNSLGNFPVDLVGETLRKMAANESENVNIRLNSLYALYHQKNLTALKSLISCPMEAVSMNAKGLSALLMPTDEGLQYLIDLYDTTSTQHVTEFFHFFMEIARPEDLGKVVELFDSAKGEERRGLALDFLTAFLSNKAGPKLDKAVLALPAAQRKAVEILIKRDAPTTH